MNDQKSRGRFYALKWILIPVVVLFIMISLFLGFIVWKLNPTVDWNDENVRISLFGHDVDLDEDHGMFYIGGRSLQIPTSGSTSFEDNHDIAAENIKNFEFKFSNGKIRFTYTPESNLSVRCKLKGVTTHSASPTQNNTLSVVLLDSVASKCDVYIPQGVDVLVKGGNGEVKFINIHNNLDFKMANGKVKFIPDPTAQYKYDFQIQNGRVGEFKQSTSDQAYKIKAEIINGLIETE